MSTNQENTPIKHTPGPWRADWNGLGEAYNIASTAPGQVLNMAEVHSFHDEEGAGPTAEATANAALIAAAPELLAFAELVMRLNTDEGLSANGLWILKELAGKAIAKAEGKE